MSNVIERLDQCNREELMHIMQGFRSKQNKNLYQKIRRILVDHKKALDLKGSDLINMMFCFAAYRPKQYGSYRVYAAEELDELLAHYEHDLNDAAEEADAQHITRLAQSMYIFKTAEFENIWWRVENRVNTLVEQEQFSASQLVQIVRAFSRA